MKVLRYFMRYEDKYWGIFLVAILFLYLIANTKYVAKEKKRYYIIGAIYGAVSYLVFLCPWTYKLWETLGFDSARYYLLSISWMLIVWIPVAVAAATNCLGILYAEDTKKGMWKQVCLWIGVILLFAASGRFAYFHMDTKPKVLGVYDEQQQKAYDLILQDAKERGFESDMTIWGPYDFMAKSRIYDARLTPIYGKDIVDDSAPYDTALRTLYNGYTAYEAEDELAENKDQQLAAIAYFMDAFVVAPCRYITVYDPYQQGFSIDAKTIFETYGYEMVGQAGGLQVYRLLGKE